MGVITLKGFRDFLSRGNVIDLAVAVVVGAAFTALVNALVDGVFNPLIGAFFNSKNLENSLTVSVPTLSSGHSELKFGLVLAAIIKFLLVSAVIYFIIILPLKRLKEIGSKGIPAPLNKLIGLGANNTDDSDDTDDSSDSDDSSNASSSDSAESEKSVELLTEIRDLLKAQNTSEGDKVKPANKQ